MAKRSISQKPAFGKVENNHYINSLAARNKKTSAQRFQNAGRILSMSNDDAVEFLRENGFSQIVPGTHFATIRDYAAFFDVKEDALQAYLYRYGLDAPNNPVETLSSTLESFFTRAGLTKVGEYTVLKKSTGRGVFDFHFEKLDTHFVTEWTRCMKFTSARCALAVLPFIASWQRNKHANNRSVTLCDALMSMLDEREEAAKMEAARIAAAVEAEKTAGVKGAIAEDALYELIKRAVSEVMSGAKISLVAPDVNT